MGLRTNWCAAPFLVGENLHLERGDGQQSLTDSWKEILEDPEIQIVIEVMGGIEPARTYITEALHAGKQFIYTDF